MTATTLRDLLTVARAEVGYHETGGPNNDGNDNKYARELDPALNRQPWCAIYLSWVWKHAGHPFPAIDHPYGFSYCPDAVIWAKKHGLWNDSGHYLPGDTIFYDFTGHGVAEHVEIVEEDKGAAGIRVIGGNTSGSNDGSQANGGEVAEKLRPHGPSVLGVLSSHVWLAKPPRKPQPHPVHVVKRNPWPKPWGTVRRGGRRQRVRWVQWAVGVTVDGAFGTQTVRGVETFQRYHGLPVTGVVDRATRNALAKVTH